MVTDLDSLPFPDFDDYFSQLADSGVASGIRPILVFETARGCWWGEKHHCTFCGLNGEGMQYRSKSARRAREELDYLLDRHENRMVHVVDNILDFRYFDIVSGGARRPDVPAKLLLHDEGEPDQGSVAAAGAGRARDITPGIESLSTPILRLMKKGVTELQNVRLLKWCAELGIVPNWALMYGFPGRGSDGVPADGPAGSIADAPSAARWRQPGSARSVQPQLR